MVFDSPGQGEHVGVWTALRRWRVSSPAGASSASGWLCLGAAPLQLLAVQVVTGLLLALHYRPGDAGGYESVQLISEQLSYGWFVRGLHRWSAMLTLVAAVLHQLRVLWAGTYRAPRRWTWVLGWLSLLVIVAACFTGEAITGQQRGVWSLVLGANLAAEVAVVGPAIRSFALGADAWVAGSAARLYALHAMLLPGLLVVLVGAHLGWVRWYGVGEGMTDGSAPKQRRRSLGPDQLRLDLLVGLGLLVLCTVLATVDPGTLGPAAAEKMGAEAIRPHWYALPAVRWVRLVPASVAAWSFIAAVIAVALWPWLDERLCEGPIGRAIGLAGRGRTVALAVVVALVGLGIWEALGAS